MKETRRLDVLAAIGGVLAVCCVMLAVAFVLNLHGIMNTVEGRWDLRPVMRQKSQPDVKADLEVMLAKRDSDGEPNVNRIKESLVKYPNSPRLNLRLGTYADEPLASNALRRLSQLDSENALPLYLLAGRAAAKNSWNEAHSLVKKANGMRKLDPYDLPLGLAHGDGCLEMIMHTASTGINARLTNLARRGEKHALRLHDQGSDAEALLLLDDLRHMGRRFMQKDGADAVDVLSGSLVIRSCDNAARQIAKDNGDNEEFARMEAELGRCLYVKAGCKQYAYTLVENMLGRLVKFLALSFSLYGVLHFSLSILLGLVIGCIQNRKSNGAAASDIHLFVTEEVFSPARLFRMCALVLLGCGVSTIMLANSHGGPHSPLLVAWLAMGIMIPLLVPLAVGGRLKLEYRDTYNRLAEDRGLEPLPKRGKLTPAADWHEMHRRLAGVDGGFVITLSIWALMVCTLLKVQFNAFPWQISKAMGGMPQAEMKYVKDLVDGKIKVPQKYIDQIKREEARYNVQRSTSNAQHSTKSAGGSK